METGILLKNSCASVCSSVNRFIFWRHDIIPCDNYDYILTRTLWRANAPHQKRYIIHAFETINLMVSMEVRKASVITHADHKTNECQWKWVNHISSCKLKWRTKTNWSGCYVTPRKMRSNDNVNWLELSKMFFLCFLLPRAKLY